MSNLPETEPEKGNNEMGSAQVQAQTAIVGNVVMTLEEIAAEQRLEAWKQSEREKARIAILERIESQKRVPRFRM